MFAVQTSFDTESHTIFWSFLALPSSETASYAFIAAMFVYGVGLFVSDQLSAYEEERGLQRSC